MKRPLFILILACFSVTNIMGPNPVLAQDLRLPAPGVMVHLSPAFNPSTLKGIKVHPDNPFRFDFILDVGDGSKPSLNRRVMNPPLQEESTRLIKYFLASLTIPDKDLWVNLSPYEKDRIIPQSFGLTGMGRDLLAEDYMLKQITASLIYPEDPTGKQFWKRIYEESAKRFGTTNIPVDTFNKVWIVPEKAVVYENAKSGTAYVVESRLKVMLEQDYLSLQKHHSALPVAMRNSISSLGANIVREIVIPALTKEVNEDNNFSMLRQIYNSLILATWYKKKIKDSILSQVYENKNKTTGITIEDPQEKQRIYERYLQAFKKGAYNYIKEEQDLLTQQIVPRKYFSGGFSLGDASAVMISIKDFKMDSNANRELLNVEIDPAMTPMLQTNKADGAMFKIQQLASDLSDRELDKKWDAYLEKEELSPNKTLVHLFTRPVKEALLDDPTLRPVFLQVLPQESMDAIIVPDHMTTRVNEKIGDKTLLEYMNEYSCFKLGADYDLNNINGLASRNGMKVVVGVTDRYSSRHILTSVANGRQVYFPLPDNTWLGVKGSGQNRMDEKGPHYGNKWGLATREDALRAMHGTEAIAKNKDHKSGKGLFVQFLGYRRMHALPDGKGGLKTVERLETKNVVPVLIFNRMLYPQRFSKLPSLLDVDPNLSVLCRKISKVLVSHGLLPEWTLLSASDLVLWLMKKRGENEAIKINLGWRKTSINPQDWEIAGPEADNEEWVFMRLSWEDQINGMEVTAFAYLDLLAMLPASIKERLPSFTEVLRILFQSYFTIIELKYLKQWSESTFSSIPERLMSNQEAYKLIISLAKEEMLKRDQAMSGLTHDQHPDGRVLTPNEVRKKMVISAEQRNMLIGFMRDEQGKIQPVFSHSPRLLSVREGISAGRWRPGRLVEMVPLAIGGQELGIDTTENWYYLPSDLKQIFEKHKVLVTAKEVSTPFQLLMYSPQDEERKKRQGRTGVLFRDGLPIIIEIRGKEFIVELKGAGLPSGGFDRENAGAVDIFSAQRELLNLEEEKKGQAYVHGETVRAAANIRLMGGKGYLVRLSPGSIRSSFQDNDAIPVMKTSRKVYLMSREIGRFFREGKVLMSHPENFIVDRNGENLISTDYADVFYIQVFPKKLEDEDITPKAAIEISLDFIREITGYAKEPHEIFRMFVGGLADGLELPLPEKEQLMGLANMKEVVEFIWQKIFVKAYWESITANGVIPERLINLPLDLDTGIEKGLLEGVETETRRLYRALKAQFERDNDNQTAPSLLAEMENTHFIGPQIVEATISSPALERLVFGVRHKNIPNSGQPELLAHLKEQIEILQDMVPYFDGHSQKEINWNLKIAQEKYQRIASMKTNEFLMAALRDKDFIVGMFMLPYYAHLKGNSFGPGTVRYESKMRLIATHNSGLVDLSVPQDEAQLAPGGIDLTSLKSLSVQHNGQGIKFHIEPAMLAQLQNAPGFIPVIINMQPLRDLRAFLELADS